MRHRLVFALLATCGTAHAAPMQVELQDPLFRRLEAATKSMPIRVTRPEVATEGSACFDTFGMRNLDLFTEIAQINVTPKEGSIELKVALTRLELIGEMFAEGGFPCPDIEEPVNPLVLEDVQITASVVPAAVDGKLTLTVLEPITTTVGAASITGPSDFIVGIIEDYDLLPDVIVPMAAEQAIAQGLLYATDMVEANRAGAAMGVGYAVRFDEVAAHAGGVTVRADASFAVGEKAACLPVAAVAPVFGSVAPSAVPAGASPSSGAVVAAADSLLSDLLAAAWWSGVFCAETTAELPESIAKMVEGITNGETGPITVRAGVREQPTFVDNGPDIDFTMRGITLEVGGAKGTILALQANLAMRGRVRADEATRLLHATLEDVSLDVVFIESTLHETQQDAEELVRFLEDDFPEQFRAGVQDLPVADGILDFGFGKMTVDMLGVQGDIVSGLSMYLASDPLYDMVAPETTIGAPRGSGDVTFDYSATDDRAGALVYSWRVDEGRWSAWSQETKTSIVLMPGEHVFEVMARDRWGNVDPTPAAVALTVEPRNLGSCACSVEQGSRPPPFLAAFALLALALRRHHHPVHPERAPKGRVEGRRRAGLRLFARTGPLVLAVLLSREAHAQETMVMPEGRFRASVTYTTFQGSLATTTGTTVQVPTGYPELGVDVKTRQKLRYEGHILIPSVSWGVTRDVTVMAMAPVFMQASVDVKRFEVRALGVDVTDEAQSMLSSSGFRDPSGGTEPMSDWSGRGVGDLILGARWRVMKTRTRAYAVTGAIELPTGRRDDPRVLTDLGFGDGHAMLVGEAAIELRARRFIWGASGGYRAVLPAKQRAIMPGMPETTYVRDPGDILRATMTARRSFKSITTNGSLLFEHHLPDAGLHNPNMPSMEGTAVGANAMIGLSSVKPFMRGRAAVPAAIAVGGTFMYSPNVFLSNAMLELRTDLFF